MARRRTRGTGSVYFSKADGAWVARYPLGVRDGKRLSKRHRAASKRDAERALEEMRRAYGAGFEPNRQPLGRYLREWLAGHKDVRESTRRSYEGHIRLHIDPLLGGILLDQLKPRDVRRLIVELEAKGLSAGTIHLVIRTLSVALNSALHDRAITDNATVGVRLPRLDREPVRPLTAEEADAIRDAVAGHWVEPIVRLLLGSGLRLGEAIGLDQDDIRLEEAFVRVRRTKTTVRAVPISDDAVRGLQQALAGAPRRGPHEPVFFGRRTGDRLRGDAVTHALPKLLDGLGLGHLHPHALRHAVATLMVAQGVHMRVVASQLGHANPALTARVYSHVTPQLQQEAVRVLDRRRG